MSVSFLYALLITTSSPLTLQTQSWGYATEQGDNDQEKTQTSSENDDNSDKTNSDSESLQGVTADSDQSENNSNRNDDDNDSSSTNQNSDCPNNPEITTVPLYIGQDGCQYPCPPVDSNNQNNVPEGCPLEPASPQTSTGLSLKEENQIQTPPQEQQQSSQDSPNQNAFVSPSINSDTSTPISNSEAPTTTQKSFTPAGKLRSGPTQTESSIPLLPNDLAKPKPLDSGNEKVEGTLLVTPSQSESSRPSLLGEPSKPFDPSKPFTPTKPFTSGSQTSSIGGFQGDAHLVVYSNFTKAKNPLIAKYCVSTFSTSAIKSLRTEAQANPYCIDADFDGTLHSVQAPGLVQVKVIDSNFDTVYNDCKIYINPKESKSCLLGFVNK